MTPKADTGRNGHKSSGAWQAVKASAPAALLWGLSCALSCILMLVFFRGWDWSAQTFEVTTIFGAGAILGFYPAVYTARYFTRPHSKSRLIAIVLLLALATLFFTACLFALQYRLYFVQWHGDAFSRLWLWQQAFTAAGAVYQYVVLGLRLYFPIAIIALFATSWWVNRLPD